MGIGIIKKSEIRKNKDSTKKSLLLQVEITEDDIKTIELFPQAGEDTNPAVNCRVFFAEATAGYLIGLSTTDDIEPEVDPGEKEIYSTDSPATQKKAYTKWDKDGNIEINGSVDFAVSWTDLNTQLQSLVSAINAALATKKDEAGAAGTLSLDLSSAKVEKVKLP
jgi:hypothetical protein